MSPSISVAESDIQTKTSKIMEDPCFGFLVVHRETQHIYAVYADGRIEGFPSGCMIANGIPALIQKAVQPTSDEKIISTEHSSPTQSPTDFLSGASHG